jgi:hypothetical protein
MKEGNEVKHRIGNFYKVGEFEGPYLLAQVSHKRVCLVGLLSANRFTESVCVDDTQNITNNEFEFICDGTECSLLPHPLK